jgi:stage V sporulation protein G
MEFTITHLQVYPVREPKGKLIAYARVLLNDQLQLTALRLYNGVNGPFVSYPSDPNYKGEDYRQVFYPVTKELRDTIEAAVIKEYNEATTEA